MPWGCDRDAVAKALARFSIRRRLQPQGPGRRALIQSGGEAMTWSEDVFVVSFLSLVYWLREVVRPWRSPELKRDIARLREQRRQRKQARRQ